VLIVDGSFAHRAALKQTFATFGVAEENFYSAKNLQEASGILTTTSIQLIVSDFLLEDGVGTSLIEAESTRTIAHQKTIFILLSSINTQAAIANAAEMEVDQFILKPYSVSQLQEVLEMAIKKRQSPGQSDKLIEDGKAMLALGEFEKARVLFEKAKSDSDAYARACSYLGEIKNLRKQTAGATQAYQDGLESTEVHFRCLMGLFKTLLNSKQLDKAYGVLKELVIFFPESPERLNQALALAIKTKHFVDIEEFLFVYKLMYEKPKDLWRHMSSALLVNGHYHLIHKNPEAALANFVEGISIGHEDPGFLDYVKKMLNEYGLESKFNEVLFKARLKPGSPH